MIYIIGFLIGFVGANSYQNSQHLKKLQQEQKAKAECVAPECVKKAGAQ